MKPINRLPVRRRAPSKILIAPRRGCVYIRIPLSHIQLNINLHIWIGKLTAENILFVRLYISAYFKRRSDLPNKAKQPINGIVVHVILRIWVLLSPLWQYTGTHRRWALDLSMNLDGGIRREICTLSVTTAWPQHQAPKINIFRCQKLTKEIYAFRIACIAITDMHMWPVWRIPSSNSELLTLSPGNLEITTSIRIEYWCLDIRHMRLLYYPVFYLNQVCRSPVLRRRLSRVYSCINLFVHSYGI